MKLTQRQIALVISKDRDQVALILMVYLMSLVELKLVEQKMEIVKERHHLLV